MTTTNISSIAGFVAGDNTAGSGNPGNTPSNITNINNFIAAMAPGDELIFDKPFISNATIVIQNKLGCRFHGASPFGARITPNGNFDGVRMEDNEYCVFEGFGVWPRVNPQTAGIGIKVIEGGAAGSAAGLNNKYRDLMVADRNRQQNRWGLGTGRPYKGFEVSGLEGGYNDVFRECQAQGCVSDAWSVGIYGQPTRGTVNVTLSKCQAGAAGGNGFSVFCSEALNLVDGTEALGCTGHGLLTYPDNGGKVEVLLFRAGFDTNWGHGCSVQAGGAGVGGKVIAFQSYFSWFGNNGNKDVDPNHGASWNLSHGFIAEPSMASKIDEVTLVGNRSGVNALCGFAPNATARLQVQMNYALDNAQYGAGSAWGLIFTSPIPLSNTIQQNTADGRALAPYTGGLQAGIATVASVGAFNAETNVSTGNFPGFNYSFHAAPAAVIGGGTGDNY